jgi:hypothetical protein
MSISALDTISLPDSFEPNSHDSFAHPHNCDNSWRIVQKQNPRLPSYNNSFNLDLREIAKGKKCFRHLNLNDLLARILHSSTKAFSSKLTKAMFNSRWSVKFLRPKKVARKMKLKNLLVVSLSLLLLVAMATPAMAHPSFYWAEVTVEGDCDVNA